MKNLIRVCLIVILVLCFSVAGAGEVSFLNKNVMDLFFTFSDE